MIKKLTSGVASLATVAVTSYFTALHTELLAQTKQIATSAAKGTVYSLKEGKLQELMNGNASLKEIAGDAINKMVAEYAAQNIPETITVSCRPFESATPCLERNIANNKDVVMSQLGLAQQEQQINQFNTAYLACKDELNTNPDVDLDDPNSTYSATVQCLANKGHQGDLAQIAEFSPHLKNVLASLDISSQPSENMASTQDVEQPENL